MVACSLEDGEVGPRPLPCQILDRVIVIGLPHALVCLPPVLLIRTSAHFILYLSIFLFDLALAIVPLKPNIAMCVCCRHGQPFRLSFFIL